MEMQALTLITCGFLAGMDALTIDCKELTHIIINVSLRTCATNLTKATQTISALKDALMVIVVDDNDATSKVSNMTDVSGLNSPQT